MCGSHAHGCFQPRRREFGAVGLDPRMNADRCPMTRYRPLRQGQRQPLRYFVSATYWGLMAPDGNWTGLDKAPVTGSMSKTETVPDI